MRIMAYIEFHFFADKLRPMPEEGEDTTGRLRKGLDKCSEIPGLAEMHFIYGREPETLTAIAKVEIEEIPEITNVINEVKKVFPLKTCTTFLVQPQLRPGETLRNSDFL